MAMIDPVNPGASQNVQAANRNLMQRFIASNQPGPVVDGKTLETRRKAIEEQMKLQRDLFESNQEQIAYDREQAEQDKLFQQAMLREQQAAQGEILQSRLDYLNSADEKRSEQRKAISDKDKAIREQVAMLAMIDEAVAKSRGKQGTSAAILVDELEGVITELDSMQSAAGEAISESLSALSYEQRVAVLGPENHGFLQSIGDMVSTAVGATKDADVRRSGLETMGVLGSFANPAGMAMASDKLGRMMQSDQKTAERAFSMDPVVDAILANPKLADLIPDEATGKVRELMGVMQEMALYKDIEAQDITPEMALRVNEIVNGVGGEGGLIQMGVAPELLSAMAKSMESMGTQWETMGDTDELAAEVAGTGKEKSAGIQSKRAGRILSDMGMLLYTADGVEEVSLAEFRKDFKKAQRMLSNIGEDWFDAESVESKVAPLLVEKLSGLSSGEEIGELLEGLMDVTKGLQSQKNRGKATKKGIEQMNLDREMLLTDFKSQNMSAADRQGLFEEMIANRRTGSLLDDQFGSGR